ncbi:MAG TPA: glycosyltransferase family 4 protein [Terriglobales bacterium]|jgi:glycosyltransferase involved in cell wall biosynthesis|nr:glycosyltransferase family 4 protein [Terriglobales bacterium]
MHVLITTDTLNGNWTYTRELVSGLITRGFRITLVSFGGIPLPEQTAWMERLYGLTYHPTAFRLDWMQEGQHDFTDASEYLCSVIREAKPDIFHSNHLCYGALPLAIPRVVVAHGDLITWWQAVHGREPTASPWLRWYRQTISEGMAAASVVVAPNEWLLNSVRACYGPGRREHVIHHGRNPIFFNPYTAKEDSVLAVGRLLDPAKQVGLLTQRMQPYPVCIVGDEEPPANRSVRADVRFQDGTSGVALRGPQSEAQMRLLYSKAAVFAGTSRYETSGMNILEAALSRCALVLNDIPSLRELWGNAALYFQTNDPENLADTIRIFSDDPQLRRNFANRAFQRARECFNAHRMTDNYVQLYHSVMAKKAAAA